MQNGNSIPERNRILSDKGVKLLSNEEQKIALSIAKKAIASRFENKEKQARELPEIFQEKRGIFVSIYINKNLRGCIGNFQSNVNLAENIKTMAKESAFHDPRFEPLDKEELNKIKIEISVLSPMEKIKDASSIKLGKHGVYIKNGFKTGVFLPQVATEMGWNKEQFLENLCSHKADLSSNCYLDPLTEIYIFTAQIVK